MSDIVERLEHYAKLAMPHYPNDLCSEAKREIERLQRRVTVLEMVIQEELDEFDCRDEANRMIVESIHERGASVALSSNQCGGK